MRASNEDEERMQLLEEKVAYLEKHLADMDTVVRESADKLDLLLQQVKRLSGIERVIAERDAPADDKPPHW